jgi:hypothetical protein
MHLLVWHHSGANETRRYFFHRKLLLCTPLVRPAHVIMWWQSVGNSTAPHLAMILPRGKVVCQLLSPSRYTSNRRNPTRHQHALFVLLWDAGARTSQIGCCSWSACLNQPCLLDGLASASFYLVLLVDLLFPPHSTSAQMFNH